MSTFQAPQSPTQEFYGLADKPPIPPRGVPPPVPQRQSSTENVLNNNVNNNNSNSTVQIRPKTSSGSSGSYNGNDYDNGNYTNAPRPFSHQPNTAIQRSVPVNGNNNNGNGEDVWLRHSELRSSGWGQTRHDANRPASLPVGGVPPPTGAQNPGDMSGLVLGGGRHQQQSAESSSESEASFIKSGGSSKDAKDKKAGSSGVFRIFSKKKSKNHN